VAFKTRAEAETYQKEHGGRLLSYTEAVHSVKDERGPVILSPDLSG
jgi:nitrous oxide reductase accessory protein NosL